MAELAPDKNKRSFVSEADANNKPQETGKISSEIPSADVSLHLINGKIDVLIQEMKAFNALFSKASQFVKSQPSFSQSVIAQSTPVLIPTSAPAPAPETSPRMNEIMTAFESVKELLVFDDNGSNMVLIVRPAHYLGSDNFGKIAAIVRGLGGNYVSAGKNSHFEIPKAVPKRA